MSAKRERAKPLPGPLVECRVRRAKRTLRLPVTFAARLLSLQDGKRGEPLTLVTLDYGWRFRATHMHDKWVFGGYAPARSGTTKGVGYDGLKQRKPTAHEIYKAVEGGIVPCLCMRCVRALRARPPDSLYANRLQSWEWGYTGHMPPEALALSRLHHERMALLITVAEANDLGFNEGTYERVTALLETQVNTEGTP